jgi:hypothetical protein
VTPDYPTYAGFSDEQIATHHEQKLRELLNADDEQLAPRGLTRQGLLAALNRFVRTVKDCKPGDIVEVLDNETPTGRTYMILPVEDEFKRPDYTLARQKSHPNRLTVDLHNNVRVKVINVGVL